MNGRIMVFVASLVIVLVVALVYAIVAIPIRQKVCNIDTGLSYSTIQEAVDANETKDGNTLLVYAGVYRENVEVTKRLLIKGRDRGTAIVERGSRGVIAVLVYASNSTIADLTVRDSHFGIWCLRTTGCEVSGNSVVNCTTGIRIDYSNNTLVTNNEVLDNVLRGIHIYGSSYNTIANNTIVNTRGSYAAIDVEGYPGTGDAAIKNTLFRNRLTNNSYGVWINVGASETKLYHNSFLNNTHDLNRVAATGTIWNDDYPFGGNYWSGYAGLDLYSGQYQNITGNDGIGDTPYAPDTGSIDRYPFMQPPT